MSLPAHHLPATARAQAKLNAEFVALGAHTRLARVHETGGLRLRFPHTAHGCEAVIINTAGGIVGGDQVDLTFEAGPKSHVTLTSQAAEKIYRAQSFLPPDQAALTINLTLRNQACLEWLPQEMILFDKASLRRDLVISMEAGASLTVLESTLFGRIAMGENSIECRFRDRWRIYRQNQLIFADDLRVNGPASDLLDRKAGGAGARAIATLLHVSPDAEARSEDLHTHLQGAQSIWGLSAWNGFMLIRLASPHSDVLRRDLIALLQNLRGREAPRVWT